IFAPIAAWRRLSLRVARGCLWILDGVGQAPYGGFGLGFTAFKCTRERVVLALWLSTPARELFFAAVTSLANWSGFAYRVDLAASTVALAISISMLVSAASAADYWARRQCQNIP